MCQQHVAPLGPEDASSPRKGGPLDAVTAVWDTITTLTSTKTVQYEDSAVRARKVPLRETGVYNTYTAEEVAKHTAPDDCWLVIKNKVYDVSNWGDFHPGGPVIYTQGGRDASDTFTTFHAGSTWKVLKDFCIGELQAENVPEALEADFRKLRQEMVRDGMFVASTSYYAWKVMSLLGLAVTSIAILMNTNAGPAAIALSAFLMGVFFQQSGWLAHDFCHNQVFTNRKLNAAMGYFLGNVCQGFSVDWWKRKHNTHHAVPNEMDAAKYAVDPDIDTLPMLAWSADMLATVPEGSPQRMILRIQHYLCMPVLLLARLAWAQQSASHAAGIPTSKRAIESGLIILHYLWTMGSAVLLIGPLPALAWAAGAQLSAGLMLAFVFIQSHNGMEVYEGAKDFWSAQMVSTRNITSTVWNDWFTGGLNYQIEHHLFPTMPRHNLGACAKRVQALCAKHDVVYEDCDLRLGTKRVLQRLAEVAAHA